MKTKQILFAISLLLFAILLTSWVTSENRNSKDDPAVLEIPELLDRHEAVQMEKEWENVQNYYAQAKSDLANNPNDAEALLTLARVFIQEARVTGEHGHYYPAAMTVLNKLLSQNGTTKDQKFGALTAKASVDLSQHDFHAALETAKSAIVLNPYNANIYGALTDAYVELGQYEEAVKAADKMVSLRPDLRSYSRISYLREIHGDIDGAIEAMKMAVGAGAPGTEHTAWARVTLGQLYEEEKGDLDYAEAIYKRCLAERPDYPFAIAALASIEMKRENYHDAEGLLAKAIEAIPEVGFYTQLAEIYQKTDRNEKATSLTKEIFLMLEDDVKSGHNMNLEYANFYLDILDDPESAMSYAQKEYYLRPQNKDVQQLIARITQ